VGKTTIARLLAAETDLHFVQISAIFTGVPELRKGFRGRAAPTRERAGDASVRRRDPPFQQGAAGRLPAAYGGWDDPAGRRDDGEPVLRAERGLLSRAQVLVLERLSEADLAALLERAETELGRSLPLTPEARHSLLGMADGDGRALLNLVEQVAAWKTAADLDAGASGPSAAAARGTIRQVGGGALQPDLGAPQIGARLGPDAALYWFARMLEGGEDPRFLARRITRMAVEDIGLADPAAQGTASMRGKPMNASAAPEGELALAQAVLYLALAPKSNATYVAYKAARASAKSTGSLPPPKHILNAPTA
jgi:putative ATPase